MTNPKIVIIGGGADDGEEMAIYANGILIGTGEIDGSQEYPNDLADFLSECGVSATMCGITDVAQLDGDPDVVTESPLREDYPENLSDIADLFEELK